ncbi:MAG: hypothetical protein NT010_08485 [Proteobacteria bacterium]|nr:hypothetical protein [Pseudomonadota bacterium]
MKIIFCKSRFILFVLVALCATVSVGHAITINSAYRSVVAGVGYSNSNSIGLFDQTVSDMQSYPVPMFDEGGTYIGDYTVFMGANASQTSTISLENSGKLLNVTGFGSTSSWSSDPNYMFPIGGSSSLYLEFTPLNPATFSLSDSGCSNCLATLNNSFFDSNTGTLIPNHTYSLNLEFYGYSDGEISFQVTETPVPLPPAVWLLGSGLLSFIGLKRKYLE